MLSKAEVKRKYLNVCKRSFKTKLDQFLLSKCVADESGVGAITMDEFNRYVINDADIRMYAAVYYQQPYEHMIKGKKIIDLYSIIGSWKRQKAKELVQWERCYKIFFEKILPCEYFEDLLRGDLCFYCHITVGDINELIDKEKIFKKRETRGFSMEIDRKDPNKEYSKENVVLCCYWCNNAKTDEFTETEFKTIASEIKEVWQKRLGRKLRD